MTGVGSAAILFGLTSSLLGAGESQDAGNVLTYGILGSEKGAYSSAMRKIPVQKLLLDIAAQPRAPDFVDAALKDVGLTSADLQKLGLIRLEHDRYVIGFYLLTKTDETKTREVAETYAEKLAALFLARRAELERLFAAYDAKGVDPKAVAYVVLGCFSLDWDGLNLTAEKGYRAQAKERPNGERFMPWAHEISDVSVKGLYWGSHNDYQSDAVFTSFGDHFSVPRTTLPDLFWGVPARSGLPTMEPELKLKLARVVSQALGQMSQRSGRLMLSLRDGEKSVQELSQLSGVKPTEVEQIVSLLVELDYLSLHDGRCQTRVPLLTSKDQLMIVDALRIGREVMSAWLSAEYAPIKAELAGTSPFRQGVPYEEGFGQIWHYVFGATNRRLIEAGLFADPYAEGRKFKGFIPAVWHPSLNPDLLTKETTLDKP